ncbi:NlpC/P60 family peptidoglycan-binding protein RipD [Mycobacterium paraffinicum]|uniref:NlpC/P60 domain-containing protein n=1 Tax=Mycobacterium paraffinicum TaxID=53378 RepID=A0ABP8RF47_9MYCO|nr:NlpC/P60 family peptidoglycan-binding protein RipD [Mycobacterium paraffinicum]
MNRIYAFAIGLALLAAPMVAPVIASADPGIRPMDYQQAADVVIARGLSQRGVPYSWAGGGITGPTRGTGTGINTVGFDASGLMQYAYAGAGIKLPRSSGAIYKVGQKVLPQQAQKGDMIFYGPEGTQSVAMYLGNNQMLEVGDVVQVSPVRANGMAPYLVRVLGVQPSPAQQLPQQVPTQQAPLQQPPVQQLPAQQAPLQQAPLQQAPLQQLPAQQQAPLPQAPAQPAPVQPAPVQQAPLQQQSAQAPVQQAPLQQLPAQQAPRALLPQLPAQQVPPQQAPVQLLPPQQSPFLPPAAGPAR